MNLNLTDKVIIVTGGGSGIGEAIVREAVEEEAIPIIVNRSREKGEALENELLEKGHSCLFVQADLSQKEACRKVIEEAVEKFGKIDVLVNNAGYNDSVGLENGSPEQFMESIQSNIFHYYTLAHYALPYLIKSKGNIINISSKTAITGQGNSSAYIASKAGQLGLTREWAVELLPYGIRVNAVLPAEVMTPMYRGWLDTYDHPEEKLKEITSRIPLGQRMTTPEEIAYTVLFTASDKSAHTTGQYLFPDGGYTHLDRAIGS
ncbi:L-fucose dehydrogenase [Catalinimonas alkaloidigena]|uniref:SDR family oxidoreductase n=1 Tax=Catalinimonas alkaloidigena TaxID=1075417 RepID=UPI00240575AC|nr:SDR family oxidoreductase [Catalinimonas alkaloidigena]MDF9795599.1 L-fucose dehydrogenase [Catalinimonas alkaloidigena]